MEWCKKRAREYLKRGDYPQALTSMLSDLNKNAETSKLAKSPAISMIAMSVLMNQTYDSVERFIEGFN